MITGEYIADCTGISKSGTPIDKCNVIISNDEFKDAKEFFDFVNKSVVEEYQFVDHVRIVGVFKL